MLSRTFFDLVALLYYLCFVSLGVLTISIATLVRRNDDPSGRLRNTFVLLALSLFAWQATLFLEVRVKLPVAQLWVGRFNYAIVAILVYLVLQFVRQIRDTGSSSWSQWSRWLRAETGLLFTLTLVTPLVDASEQVMPGERAITIFGPLFPLYLLHILLYAASAVGCALQGRRYVDATVRRQLGITGIGLLATATVAFITNAMLPYEFADYRFCDVGGISTLFFVLAIAYATFIHGLFEPRVIVRETLVFGLLLAFILGTYSASVFIITQYLTSHSGKLTQFVVLLIAFSVDPLRRYLEKKADRLLFGSRRGRLRARSFSLALLFPWRRP
jgi:hypothetical protein